MDSRAESLRACLSRLLDMQRDLAQMEPQLPDDMRALVAEARRSVDVWLSRIAAGGADLRELSGAMTGLTDLMNALTTRLLLVPWSGARGRGS